MPAEVLEVTKKFMRDPVRILATRDDSCRGIKQFYIAVEKEDWKLDTLCNLRNRDNNPSRHLLQHAEEGGLVDWKNVLA